jgi:hypothetical protein
MVASLHRCLAPMFADEAINDLITRIVRIREEGSRSSVLRTIFNIPAHSVVCPAWAFRASE